LAGYRPERVAEMVHREVASRLRRDVKDPELEPISITRVEMTRDLGRATVWYLPLGGGEVSDGLRGALGRAGKQLRGPIGRALRLRTAPELAFREDVHHEEAVRITRLLDEIGADLRSGDDAEEAP
jgi:ribosome-binding factor A